jgi:hypothetical protein
MARLERLATRHGRTIIEAVEQMAALIVAGGGAAARRRSAVLVFQDGSRETFLIVKKAERYFITEVF